jgi:peroxiredoxin
MSLTIGDLAPNFTLPGMTSDGVKQISLSDYSGKNVILLFFPAAGSGVCTNEMCTMTDMPFAQGVWANANKINIQLLSDHNKDVSQQYGAFYETWIQGLKGVSKRAAFVINTEGILLHSEVLESAGELPNFEAVNKILS